ncbi:MAG: translesion error-prone DNA polymerase V autoproteolytic subunit [Saprospiraceae bacterium]|nr:translesion error-prone DNA polymerase V autoproteolytic subunit [Saprospiraceae bacterium]
MRELLLKWASPAMDIYWADVSTELALPYVGEGIYAGFPSPASDYLDLTIDLNRELVEHPESTFYARVKGDSMQGAGIQSGDVLVVDRSLTAQNDAIVVAFLNGEFTVKRLRYSRTACLLLPANEDYPQIPVSESDDFRVWGVVTYVIKNMREGGRNQWVSMR